MPFLTWDGLIIMIEDPKIIDRWEGMGISYAEAIRWHSQRAHL